MGVRRAVKESLAVIELHALGDPVAEGEVLKLVEGLAENEGRGDFVGNGEGEPDWLAENEKSGEPLKLEETVPALVREAGAEGDSDPEAEWHEEGEKEKEPEALVLALSLSEWLGDELVEAEGDCVSLSEAE